MLPTFRASLPYTLALAVLVYLSFAFLPVLGLGQEIFAVIGVLLAGILVPVLLDVKGGATAAVLQTNTVVDYQGETTTLYVGNLPYRANEDAVKELFQRFGVVINVRLMKDRQTGRRRGFGFVVFGGESPRARDQGAHGNGQGNRDEREILGVHGVRH